MEDTDESSLALTPFEVPVEKMILAHALSIGTQVAALKLNGLGSRAALPDGLNRCQATKTLAKSTKQSKG